jgi:pimeloyl-ACP methyl ester carboxylesterase
MKSIHEAASRRAARPTVICMHASGGSGAQWRTLADRMGDDYDVIAPNLYGHGTVPAWPGAPLDIVAADTARIARRVAGAAGEVHLVGHSYGGAIALRVALHCRRRVASVSVYEPVAMRTLFDYNPKHRAASEVAEVFRDMSRALNGEDRERAARRFVDYWAGAEQWAGLAAGQRAAIARVMPVIEGHFRSLVQDLALRDYANVDSPVLYLAGRDTRASARRMTELVTSALPNVELDVLDGLGHLGPITHSEAVAARIAAFIGERTPAAVRDDRKAA